MKGTEFVGLGCLHTFYVLNLIFLCVMSSYVCCLFWIFVLKFVSLIIEDKDMMFH